MLETLALAVLLQVQTPAPPTERAIWALVVNDVAGSDVDLVRRADGPWVPLSALDREGLRDLPQGRRETIDGILFVSLSSLAPAVRFAFDDDQIVLRLTVAPEHLPPHEFSIMTTRPDNLRVARPPSAHLNYLASYRTGGAADLLTQLGASAGGWSFYGALLVRNTGAPLRGVTSLTFDQPQQRRRWVIGDVLGNASALGSAPLVGGFSLAKEPRLDPYYVNFATPAFAGSIFMPSTATVYVMGRQVAELPIRPGPFRLGNLPLSSGLGRMDVVVQDASGARQTLSLRYYLSTTLLRRGEQDYHYLAGAERVYDGTTARYGRRLGTAIHRVGVSDAITIGYEAEGAEERVSAGPTLDARLWRAGTIALAAGGSRAGTARGAAGSFAYEFLAPAVSLQARVTKLWHGYSNLYVEPLKEDQLYLDGSISAPVFRRATLSLRGQTRSVLPEVTRFTSAFSAPGVDHLGLVPIRPGRPATTPSDLRREVSLGGSLTVSRRTRLYGAATRVAEPAGRWWEGFVSLAVGVGSAISTTTTATRTRTETNVAAEMLRPAPLGPGFGYRIAADQETGRGQAEAVLQHQRGSIHAFMSGQKDGTNESAVEVSGAIAVAGGRVGLLPTVDDGFALVRVPDAPNVRVYANHQPVGRTNGSGYLFVPAMQSYMANSIGIAADDTPPDVNLTATEHLVAPGTRGAVVVNFDAAVVRSTTGHVRVREAGRDVVPSFGSLDVDAPDGPYSSPLNVEGYFYLENVPPGRHPARISYANGETCSFTLDIPSSTAPRFDLGVLVCSRDQ